MLSTTMFGFLLSFLGEHMKTMKKFRIIVICIGLFEILCGTKDFIDSPNTSLTQRVQAIMTQPSNNIRPVWNVASNFKRFLNRLVSPVRIGIKVVTLKSGHVVYQQLQDQRFTPYSNTKLITAGAALYYLGPDYQFKTQILTDGIVDGSTIVGNVYLKGSGDPSITGTDIINFIGQLAINGITSITGNFCCDYFAYDEKPYVEGTALNDIVTYQWSPVFAMIDDRNYVDRSLPGRNIFDFTFVCDQTTQDLQKIEISSLISVFGTYVQQICQAYGITVNGNFGLGKAPDNCTILVDHASEALSDLVKNMLYYSYNIDADSFFKRIGAHCYGLPGTWEKGMQAIDAFLSDVVGIPSNEFHIEDGSGISRNNVISPSNIVNFLIWMHHSPLSSVFMGCLPISGGHKSIRGRILKQHNMQTLRTEATRGVESLSGFVYNNDTPTLIFSVMFDGLIPPKVSLLDRSETEEELTNEIIGCLTT